MIVTRVVWVVLLLFLVSALAAQREEEEEDLRQQFEKEGLSWNEQSLRERAQEVRARLSLRSGRRKRKEKREEEEKEWSTAGTLATWMGMTPLHQVHIRVPLNIVLLGFPQHEEDIRRSKMSIADTVELQSPHLDVSWLEHLEHHVEHHRLLPPYSHLHSPRTDRKQVGEDAEALIPHFMVASKEAEAPVDVSHVRYNYSIEVFEPGAHAANAFAAAIGVHSRAVSSEGEKSDEDKMKEEVRNHDGWHQPVSDDLRQIDAIQVDNLVKDLLALIQADRGYTIVASNARHTADSPLETGKYGYRFGFSREEMSQIAKEEERSAHAWRGLPTKTIFPKELFRRLTKSEEKHRRRLEGKFMAKGTWAAGDLFGDHVYDALEGMDKAGSNVRSFMSNFTRQVDYPDLARKSRDALTATVGLKDEFEIRKRLSSVESCLVDMWAGKGRHVFIDLQAARLHWGNIAGGFGEKTDSFLPRLEDYLYGEDKLLKSRFLRNRPREPENDRGVHDAEASAMMTLFQERYCDGRDIDSRFCSRLGEAIELEKKGRDLPAFFEDEYIEETADRNETMKYRLFLSDMARIFSGGMKHLFTPPTVLGQFVYSKRVNFLFFKIHVGGHKGRRGGGGVDTFDIEEFKSSLEAVRASGQEYFYSTQEVYLNEDPTLSLAYYSSLTSAEQPHLTDDGQVVSKHAQYIDSSKIWEQLRHLADSTSTSTSKRRQGQKALEVPIFIFVAAPRGARASARPPKNKIPETFGGDSSSIPDTIMIDKHHLARALEDMVLVVSNVVEEDTAIPSSLECNGRRVMWDNGTALKHALRATLLFLGGVLPSHIGFSASTHNFQQEWAWSSLAGPMGSMTPGTGPSQITTDALHRAYAVDCIDENVEKINTGIEKLSRELTATRRMEDIPAPLYRDISTSYSMALDAMSHMIGNLEEMNFQGALDLIDRIDAESDTFYASVTALVSTIHGSHCPESGWESLRIGLPAIAMCLGAGFVVAIVMARCTARRGRRVKIN